jgi:hypothetical protein
MQDRSIGLSYIITPIVVRTEIQAQFHYVRTNLWATELLASNTHK